MTFWLALLSGTLWRVLGGTLAGAGQAVAHTGHLGDWGVGAGVGAGCGILWWIGWVLSQSVGD